MRCPKNKDNCHSCKEAIVQAVDIKKEYSLKQGSMVEELKSVDNYCLPIAKKLGVDYERK